MRGGIMSADIARLVLQALRAHPELRREYADLLAPELKVTAAPAALPELLTLAEVAKLLGRTRGALQEAFRRGRRNGDLHPLDRMVIVHDGVRRWPRAAVEAYLAAVAK